MILEGLAKSIIQKLNQLGVKEPKIDSSTVQANHDRYGAMIDQIHDEKPRHIPPARKKNPPKTPVKSFKQFVKTN